MKNYTEALCAAFEKIIEVSMPRHCWHSSSSSCPVCSIAADSADELGRLCVSFKLLRQVVIQFIIGPFELGNKLKVIAIFFVGSPGAL